MAAMTARSAAQWRQTATIFGTPDWDTAALAHACVVDADTDTTRRPDVDAAVGDDRDAARRLGEAGVVAVRHRGNLYDLEETPDGWELHPAAGTPDIEDLAMAAAIRAGQTAAQRRGEDWA